jgi:hypothetical protein
VTASAASARSSASASSAPQVKRQNRANGGRDARPVEAEIAEDAIGLAMGDERDRRAEHLDARDVGTGARPGQLVHDAGAGPALADAVLDGDHHRMASRVGDHLGVEGRDDPHVPHGASHAFGFESAGGSLGCGQQLAHREDADLGHRRARGPVREPRLQATADLVVSDLSPARYRMTDGLSSSSGPCSIVCSSCADDGEHRHPRHLGEQREVHDAMG